MSDPSNLNIADMNNLHFVLCGAAITIQAAWRKYKLKSFLNVSLKTMKTSPSIPSNDLSEKCLTYPQSSTVNLNEPSIVNLNESSTVNLNAITKRYFDTDFQSDVEIIVESNEIFLCHSMVLWCNIGYFKEKILANKSHQPFTKYQFELPQSIRKKCWQTIQDFIYGYDIEIENFHLFSQLTQACITLDIPSLACKLKEHELKFKCMNSNANYNNNNNNSDDYEGDEETENESSHPPFQLISNYYKFFKCVLSSYLKQKISLQQTHAYLSSSFINYENMNEHELRKCIYLLKTKLKRHNSSRLLFDLIKIFLEN